MHPVVAWFVGAAYISYKYGYQCKMLPKPHRYIALTAFISIASLVSMADETTGALFAYGTMLAMFLRGQSHNVQCDKLNPVSDRQQSGSSQSSSSTNSNSPSNPRAVLNPAATIGGIQDIAQKDRTVIGGLITSFLP